MTEKLPIIYTRADIPEQCRNCPALKDSVDGALFDLDNTDRPAQTRRQAVSDYIREMQFCQTGLVEQYKYERVTTTRPYLSGVDEYIGLDNNKRFVENGTIIVGGKAVGSVRMVQETRQVRTSKIEKECGLEAAAYNIPVQTSAQVTTELEKKINRQQRKHQKYVRDRDDALNAYEFFHTTDSQFALLLKNFPPDPKIEQRVEQRNIRRINKIRKSLGLSKYVDVEE